ncbi:MAG: type II toxin-antitoxin system VapC family toxin [Nitrolancea sp.]
MSYLIDSDWIANYLNGRQPAVDLLHSLEPSGLAISLIAYGEIYEGIFFGGQPEASERSFQSFLRAVDVIPLDLAIMRRFARIRGELRRSGQIVGDPDLLIAATAIEHDLILISGNERHFGRVPGLRLYRPPQP